MPAKVVNLLNYRINSNLVLMMALDRLPRGRKGIRFINNKKCLPGFPRLLSNHFKCLVQQGTHLTDLARSSNAGAKFKEHRLPMSLACQSVAGSLGCDSLPGADITGEDHQGIPVCDRVADHEFLMMMFLAPCPQLLWIGQQTKVTVKPLVAILEPYQSRRNGGDGGIREF